MFRLKMVLLKYLFFIIFLLGCSRNPQNIIKENYYKDNISLDKYTKVLKGSQADEFSKKLKSTYKGFGLTFVKLFGKVYVFDLLKDSPAYLQNIKKGDILLRVNNHYINKSSLEDIYMTIKKSKPEVLLTFYRKGIGNFSIVLKAQEIKTNSLKIYYLSKSKIVIKIKNFSKGLASKIEKFLRKNKHIKSITFDLRDNGGGIFEESLSLADLFIEKGLLLYEKGKKIDKNYYATSKKISNNYDIKILVNRYTASASEIFTGIMQEYKKAVVVGEKTFGKGCIQKIYKLDNGNILKVTVSEYFLPSGKNINKVGITPDIK